MSEENKNESEVLTAEEVNKRDEPVAIMQSGEKLALLSLICGIVGLVCAAFTIIGDCASIAFGILGILFVRKAVQLGYKGKLKNVSMILSIAAFALGMILLVTQLIIYLGAFAQ